MKYYIIAGEASGDMHAANLMKALSELDSDPIFRCWGGDLMEAAGGDVVRHYRDLAFMGFWEVLLNLRTILKNLDFCKQDILQFRPDALILVDYPGFNLRIAKFAHQHNIQVYYYISPQVWAWKRSRVHNIKKYVDRLFVILPFEKDFYRKYRVDVSFVGHPLLDAIQQWRESHPDRAAPVGKPVIAILPGSRKQEISTMLPVMLQVVSHFPDYQFIIAATHSVDDEFYRSVADTAGTEISREGIYSILSRAHAAIVTSGTATLETAMFRVPEVVCYRGNVISYFIARLIVRVPFISLVNLIMGREVVKELIQSDLQTQKLRTEVSRLLDTQERKRFESDYSELEKRLGGPGASRTAAEEIIALMLESKDNGSRS